MEKDGLSLIRQFITEALSKRGAQASESYMKKEVLREKLQKLLQSEISAGEVTDQKDLDEWWSTVEMASKSLRMVPFMAWTSMNKKT